LIRAAVWECGCWAFCWVLLLEVGVAWRELAASG
jgi:hypothetical protein